MSESRPWRVIIAGSRHLAVSAEQVMGAVCTLPSFHAFEGRPEAKLSGGCPTGPDKVAIDTANEFEDVALRVFKANWDAHGKAAGPIRNRQMAEYADALVLIWDGKSRGSKNMLAEAKKRGLEIADVRIQTNTGGCLEDRNYN